MVSHNMDSGGGLSGAPVYAGNKKFAAKFLNKKGIHGQERRDYCFDNVLIGLWNSGNASSVSEDSEKMDALKKIITMFVDNKLEEIARKKLELNFLLENKGKDLKIF